jgi:hypothetical protein
MPRTSRSVAQRLAAQQSAKSKKRRAPRPADAAPASSVSVDQILDEVVPSEGGARTASTPTLTTADAPSTAARPVARKPGTLGRAGSRFAPRAPVVRRRYSEYGEEYNYVWADLRRIVIVAGVLIGLLTVLSFVLN